MLAYDPISEGDASSEIQTIYSSIKQALDIDFVPLIFQYLANAPKYFTYIWNQSLTTLSSREFASNASEIARFSWDAMSTIYELSSAMKLFLESKSSSSERLSALQYVNTLARVHALLYLLTVSYRESLKGKYLGLTQIPDQFSAEKKERIYDLSEGFLVSPSSNISKSSSDDRLTRVNSSSLATTFFPEFFKRATWEMDKLVKTEVYLKARVELERYTLSRLTLLNRPLQLSFTELIQQGVNDKRFADVVYLVSELFPTQAPYKLNASSIMRKALSEEKS